MKIHLTKINRSYSKLLRCFCWQDYLLIRFFLPLIITLIPLKLFTNSVIYAQTINAETSIQSSQNTLNTIPIKAAINHAKVFYGIDIIVNKKLLNEQVPKWFSEHQKDLDWAKTVFKKFDKIIQYDKNGKITKLQIIDFKIAGTEQDSNHNTSVTGKQIQKQYGLEYSVTENATSSIIREPETDSDLDSVLSIDSTKNNELPEGVTIHNTPSSLLDSQEVSETLKDLPRKPQNP